MQDLTETDAVEEKRSPSRPSLVTIIASLSVLGGLALLLLALVRVSDGLYSTASAALVQSAVMLATGMLIFKNHRRAVLFLGITAGLFTLATIAQGVTPRDLILTAVIWWAFWRYAKWRKTFAVITAQSEMELATEPASTSPDSGTLFCRKCGVQIPADSTFCEKCGTRRVQL